MSLTQHYATQRAMSAAQASYDAMSEPEGEDELSDSLDYALEELHSMRARLHADPNDPETRAQVVAGMREIAAFLESDQ
jgi:peptide subunit release factor 1 (eRF1)